MTVRYVNWEKADDTGDGLSYANAKKTLNAIEDLPVAGDDWTWVRAGPYRELLTCDVNGTAGHPITYAGDVDGSHTDGVGGIVRVTGSDNDLTATRAQCIVVGARNYRTFQGFCFDLATTNEVTLTTGTNLIIQDCYFGISQLSAGGFYCNSTATTTTIQRCTFHGMNYVAIYFYTASDHSDSAHLIQNCFFLACGTGVRMDNVGGMTIKNNTFQCRDYGVRCAASPAAGQVNNVNNNIIVSSTQGIGAVATTDITEDYNSLFATSVPYTNVTPGAHSNAYPALTVPPVLLAGYKYPWGFPSLSQWSPLRAIAGTGEATDDLFGRARPATSEKKSWGAVQFTDTSRSTATKQTGAASMKLLDAGRHQIIVPTTNVSTTFTVSCYREADYTGTASQLVIKQPGQADVTVTDADTDNAEWHALTTGAITPAATPPYCIVELVSNNTKIPTHQVETQTAVVTTVVAGNARCVVTAAGMPGSPVTVTFAVLDADADTVVATKARAALIANANVNGFFVVSGAGADIILTKIIGAANDTTMNFTIEDVTSSGITDDTTSADTTAGAAFAVATYFDDLTVT